MCNYNRGNVHRWRWEVYGQHRKTISFLWAKQAELTYSREINATVKELQWGNKTGVAMDMRPLCSVCDLQANFAGVQDFQEWKGRGPAVNPSVYLPPPMSNLSLKFPTENQSLHPHAWPRSVAVKRNPGKIFFLVRDKFRIRENEMFWSFLKTWNCWWLAWFPWLWTPFGGSRNNCTFYNDQSWR